MANRVYSLWVGEGKHLTCVVDSYDQLVGVIHRAGDPPEQWGLIGKDYPPDVLLAVAAFFYDQAKDKLKLPNRNWGADKPKQTSEKQETISIPIPAQGGGLQSEIIVPE